MFVLNTNVACSNVTKQMDSSEKRYNVRMSKEVLSNMDLETMFPDINIRKLAEAAGNGDIKLVNTIVLGGVDVNSRGRRNATTLFWSMKNERGFEALLKLGADVNIIFDDGGSVLHWAARLSDTTILELALKHGGNPDLKAGEFEQTPMFKAISPDLDDGISKAFTVLLEHRADINVRDKNGNTLLLAAANLGRFDIVYFLLQRGADSSAVNIHGYDLSEKIEQKKKLFLPASERAKWLKKVEKSLTKGS